MVVRRLLIAPVHYEVEADVDIEVDPSRPNNIECVCVGCVECSVYEVWASSGRELEVIPNKVTSPLDRLHIVDIAPVIVADPVVWVRIKRDIIVEVDCCLNHATGHVVIDSRWI